MVFQDVLKQKKMSCLQIEKAHKRNFDGFCMFWWSFNSLWLLQIYAFLQRAIYFILCSMHPGNHKAVAVVKGSGENPMEFQPGLALPIWEGHQHSVIPNQTNKQKQISKNQKCDITTYKCASESSKTNSMKGSLF